jgi:glycosyltransferase involved in cell wall biosynthesis
MTTQNGAAPAADPLDILYLADIRFPLERANGIQTFETCHALAARGHLVTLVVRDDTIRPRRDPFEFYGLPKITTLRVARLTMAGPQTLRRVRYLAAAIWRVVRASRRGCVLTRDLGVADAVAALPAGLRPRLVYESHGFAPVFAQTRPELVSGSIVEGGAKVRRLFRREARVWRAADGYVTTTGVLAAELRERFGDRPFVLTISNGVRLPEGRQPPPGRHAVPPLVAYAGHLYPWKGVDVLIRALSQLPGVHGLIVGGFPGEPDLNRARTLARDLGLGDRVRFTGQVEPSRVASLVAEAALLVLPTVATASAMYTSPLKLFEYFATGKPVIASDLPPICEIVRDGDNALLFTAGDPNSLAAAVQRLLDDEALAASIGRSAFADVEQYSWRMRAERLEGFLRTVMAAEIATKDGG